MKHFTSNMSNLTLFLWSPAVLQEYMEYALNEAVSSVYATLLDVDR